MPVVEALQQRLRWLQIMQAVGRDTAAVGSVGEPSSVFQDAFLPIGADHCGDHLFIDLRNGTWCGCVSLRDKESGADDGVYWQDVDDMVTDIHDPLLYRKPALVGHAARRLRRFAAYPVEASIWRADTTADGHLRWNQHEIHSCG